jgi:hypothetical protein
MKIPSVSHIILSYHKGILPVLQVFSARGRGEEQEKVQHLSVGPFVNGIFFSD